MTVSDFLSAIENSNISPIDYQYYHQLFDNRTIIFNQEVTENIIEYIYLPLLDFENDDSNKPITMILNSIGGSVSEGFFLANYLKNYKKTLNIIVTGQAASVAALILAAGGKNDNINRLCYPNTYSLIHDGFCIVPPSESKTVSDIIDFNEKVDEQIRQFIIDNTNITPELYDSKTRHQWYLSAKEMKELNLIDNIIGE